MDKNLPRVFANPLSKKINNQKEFFYGNNIRNNTLVSEKLAKIFKPSNFIYKKDVVITTSKGVFNKTIIGYTKNKLLTKDNQAININDILDIE